MCSVCGTHTFGYMEFTYTVSCAEAEEATAKIIEENFFGLFKAALTFLQPLL